MYRRFYLYRGFEIMICLDHGILDYTIVRHLDQQMLRSGKGNYKGKVRGYLPTLKQHVDKLLERSANLTLKSKF